MSIASIVSKFGRTFYVVHPVATVETDGSTLWTYVAATPALTLTGFFQPSTQAEDPFQGRANTRTQGTIYFVGSQDIRIEDEIYTATTGATSVFRVRGVVNPGELGITNADEALNFTSVEVTLVAPTITAPT